MVKDVYISKKMYELINEIAAKNINEQMMVFGGKTIGNTIVVNEQSFNHFDGDEVYGSSREHVEVPLYKIEQEIALNRGLENDTFFMTHSHRNYLLLEFMYGDLSFADEDISKKLRELCAEYGLEYYDGIATGKKLYFWSTISEEFPKLMDCYVDNNKVKYNALTQITEDLEHKFR